MNCCRETTKMGVPARHRERSGEAGGPPGNRPAVPRDWSEAYLNGTSQGEPVLSLSKEHPRTPGRMAISVVAVTPGREFMKYPG
jgi:hypothetical protein